MFKINYHENIGGQITRPSNFLGYDYVVFCAYGWIMLFLPLGLYRQLNNEG